MRLKGAYIVKYVRHEEDENGNVTAVYCTYDPLTKSGESERKVKGTLHFVSAAEAVKAEFRLYEPLLLDYEEDVSAEDGDEEKDAKKDFISRLNPNSIVIKHGYVEHALANAKESDRFQFMRVGYFCADPDHTVTAPVFNRAVDLKDSFKPGK